MALYKNPGYLCSNGGSQFDEFHSPGSVTKFSGIYRCEECGRELVCEKDAQLPAQSHHPHSAVQGPILWRMVVCAQELST